MPRENIEFIDESGSDLVKNFTESQRKFRGFYMKIEGLSKSGKTYTYLSMIREAVRRGYKPENIMMYIIDYDNEGQEGVIDQALTPELFNCVRRKLCVCTEDVYRALDAYTEMAGSFMMEDPENRVAFVVFENEYRFWQHCIKEYALETRGIPLRRVVAEQQRKAREMTRKNREIAETMKDKEAKERLEKQVFVAPFFEEGQLPSYTVINANYEEFFDRLKLLAMAMHFNIIVTTRATYAVKDWTAKKKEYFLKVLGKPDKIDGMFNIKLFCGWKTERGGVAPKRSIEIRESRIREYPAGRSVLVKEDGTGGFTDLVDSLKLIQPELEETVVEANE